MFRANQQRLLVSSIPTLPTHLYIVDPQLSDVLLAQIRSQDRGLSGAAGDAGYCVRSCQGGDRMEPGMDGAIVCASSL